MNGSDGSEKTKMPSSVLCNNTFSVSNRQGGFGQNARKKSTRPPVSQNVNNENGVNQGDPTAESQK